MVLLAGLNVSRTIEKVVYVRTRSVYATAITTGTTAPGLCLTLLYFVMPTLFYSLRVKSVRDWINHSKWAVRRTSGGGFRCSSTQSIHETTTDTASKELGMHASCTGCHDYKSTYTTYRSGVPGRLASTLQHSPLHLPQDVTGAKARYFNRTSFVGGVEHLYSIPYVC